jgi:predicted lipoprotein with Yx(FWY)xxD motif
VRWGYAVAIALAMLGALVIAGCGSDDGGYAADDGSSGGSAESASGGGYGGRGGMSAATADEGESNSAGAAIVSVGEAGDLGQVIVDSEGMTLYDFRKDKGTTSSCYGACAEAWPPLTTTGEAQAMGGAEASMLGMTERKDGTMQVTYAGHPIYTFVEDAKPGEANGNDVSAFGAEWYALQPNGEEHEDN